MRDVSTANQIRRKVERNDKYYTPETLVRMHLSKLRGEPPGFRIYEPFKGKGAYYNLFPEYFPGCVYEWSEIDEGRDFFDYRGEPDIIVSNPPFSQLDKIMERCYELKPIVISFVLLQHAVTPCRIRKANIMGYYVADYHLTRVDRWFGVACILTLSNEIDRNVIDFDCHKHVLTQK